MKILGVDPGTLATGVGIIETAGGAYRLVHAETIKAKNDAPLPARLLRIYEALCLIVQQYRPEVLALEDVFFGKDIRAMVKIGEARACAMLAASAAGIPVVEYPPASVKLSVTGNGRATKTQVQKMIKLLLGLPQIPPADAADALAVAIGHAHLRKTLSAAR